MTPDLGKATGIRTEILESRAVPWSSRSHPSASTARATNPDVFGPQWPWHNLEEHRSRTELTNGVVRDQEVSA